MENNNTTVIVPWDFSEVAKYALEHAIRFAKIIDSGITLLHVVKKEKEEGDAKEKLDVIADETFNKYNLKPDMLIKVGNIFKTISDISNELNCRMVIMGTHGIKGMQKYTGSWALKVIEGTDAPFVVIQAPPQHDQFKEIVFPINFRTENREKLRWANYLAKYYRVKLHLCKVDNYSDELLKRKSKSNFIFARNYLMENDIDYEIHTLEGKKGFSDETIDFAKKIQAGLILIMTTKDISFQDYVLGAEEQKIIANTAKIPVMCVNPRKLKKEGFFG